MTGFDPAALGQADHYREMASSIRALIPSLQYSAARCQLSVLALQYEQLAEYIEAVSDSLCAPTGPQSDHRGKSATSNSADRRAP
jgi:hypothetical protein